MRFRDRLMDVATAVLVLVAIGVAARAVVLRAATDGTESDKIKVRPVEGWDELRALGTPLGVVTGNAQVIEFADYQCPFCAQAAPAVDSLVAAKGKTLHVAYIHFPLERIHPHAMAAAIAASCAGKQGAFAGMHQKLYQLQDRLGEKPWSEFALEAGVRDTGAFGQCMADPAIEGVIRQGMEAGEKLHIPGTPSFVINGYLVEGIQIGNVARVIDSLITNPPRPPFWRRFTGAATTATTRF